jgi:hypothetical protein
VATRADGPVRARPNEMLAAGDMHGIVDDAEADWLS